MKFHIWFRLNIERVNIEIGLAVNIENIEGDIHPLSSYLDMPRFSEQPHLQTPDMNFIDLPEDL